jgi:quercetin dioxygenase-like cupin family protein
MPPRRIVPGHAADGRSVVLLDGPVPVTRGVEDATFHEVWRTGSAPTPIRPDEPEPTERALRVGPDAGGGTVIRVIDFAPRGLSPMHRTESIDYGIVLAGEMTLVLTDSEVALRTGDVVVQRGTDHAWANRSDAVARMAFVLIDGRFAGPLAGTPRESGLDTTNEALR